MFFIRRIKVLGMRTKLAVACCLCASWAMAEVVEPAKDDFVLVVDAGHGGRDIGAQGEYALEKDINLNVALEVMRQLRAHPEVKVVLTRQSDVYLTLDERAQMANEKEADLFVSIHTNSSENNKIARGTETYFVGDAVCSTAGQVADQENQSAHQYEQDYEEKYKSTILLESARIRNMDHSELMARLVQEEYIKAGARVNRGVQQARFYVLMNTLMPAILTEVGFISTWDEESYLTSQKGVEEVSSSICKAVLAYQTALKEGKEADRLKELKISRNAQKTPNVPMKLDPSMGIYDEETHHLSLNTKMPEWKPEKDGPAEKRKEQADNKKKEQTAEKEVKEAPKVSAETAEAVKPQPAAGAETDGDQICFYIQLMAVREELPEKDKRLKGLWPVRYVKKGEFYKCLYFGNKDYQEVKKKLKDLSEMFPGAYVVAYRGEAELKVADALKELRKK